MKKPIYEWTKRDILDALADDGAPQEIMGYLNRWRRDWLRDEFLVEVGTAIRTEDGIPHRVKLYEMAPKPRKRSHRMGLVRPSTLERYTSDESNNT